MSEPAAVRAARSMIARIDDLRDRAEAGDADARQELVNGWADRHGQLTYCVKALLELHEGERAE